MFDEIREEEKIKRDLKEFSKNIEIDKNIYYKAMERYESFLKERKRFNPFIKIIIPVTISLLLVFSSVFPVFGNNGTLIDVINTQRINRSLNSIKNIEAFQSDENSNLALNSTIIETVLEREYGIKPQNIYKTRAQNLDYPETVAIVLMANMTNIEPENIIAMRKNNYGWGIIFRKNRIDPQVAMENLNQIRRKLEREKQIVLIRGEVETISNDTSSITVNTFPFKIYITDDTEITGEIKEDESLEIEAIYSVSTNYSQAIRIRKLDQNEIGIQTFIGKVAGINANSLILLLKDGSQKEFYITQQTLLLPPHMNLIPGRIVRCDAIINDEKLFLLKIVQNKLQPPQFPLPLNPTRRR